MRVLLTWGSKAGGTEGIARIVGETLAQAGHEVALKPALQVHAVAGFDAVIVGGALYANRWHRDARRLVARHQAELRHVPVWFFSSGPLDASADERAIPPTGQVRVLMERVGAHEHVTFGGRLAADAKGFPASAMAKTKSGDWRNPERIRTWASQVALELPTAAPGVHIDHAGHARGRQLAHGLLGWAVCAAILAGLLEVTTNGVANVLHALVVPLVFAAISVHYFRARGAREPLPTAVLFGLLVLGLDWTVATVLPWRFAWLPAVLVTAVTWATGALVAVLPAPEPRASVSPDVRAASGRAAPAGHRGS
jgi:menaquinone-dependent protoporphyrinogen oxidase